MIHVYILLSKGYYKFDILDVFELIPRSQVDFENNILMYFDSCIKTLKMVLNTYITIKFVFSLKN